MNICSAYTVSDSMHLTITSQVLVFVIITLTTLNEVPKTPHNYSCLIHSNLNLARQKVFQIVSLLASSVVESYVFHFVSIFEFKHVRLYWDWATWPLITIVSTLL